MILGTVDIHLIIYEDCCFDSWHPILIFDHTSLFLQLMNIPGILFQLFIFTINEEIL